MHTVHKLSDLHVHDVLTCHGARLCKSKGRARAIQESFTVGLKGKAAMKLQQRSGNSFLSNYHITKSVFCVAQASPTESFRPALVALRLLRESIHVVGGPVKF